MSAYAATRLLAGRTLRRFLRSPALVLSAFATPVLMMFVMLATFGHVVGRSTGVPYIARLAPLTILLTIAFSMGISAAGYFEDVHSGVLRRIRTMPVASTSLLAGRVMGDLARILAVAAVTATVAVLAGLRFERGPLAALGFFGIVALYGCLFTSLALFVAVRVRSELAAQSALNVPVAAALFLSSGYVPVDAFPAWAQPVVRVSPLTVGVEALAGLSRGGPLAAPLLGVLAWTVAGTLLFGVLAVTRLAATPRS